MISVKVSSSNKKEASSIVFNYISALGGFYLQRGFYVLPKLVQGQDDYNTIYLPEYINYEKVKVLLPGVYFSNKKYHSIGDTSMAEEYVYNELHKVKHKVSVPPEYIKDVENYALNGCKKLLKTFDFLQNKPIKVNINIRKYGSTASFHALTVEQINKAKFLPINFSIRQDQHPDRVYEMLASIISKWQVINIGGARWRETEAVSDFIATYVLGSSYKYTTLNTLKNKNPKLFKDSIKFLHQIGVGAEYSLEYDQELNKIFIAGKDYTKNLSSFEFIALKTFINAKGSLVTFDDLAKELYGEHADVKFSMWGITKTVHRTRKKLQQTGLPKNTIKSVKGEGFMLVV